MALTRHVVPRFDVMKYHTRLFALLSVALLSSCSGEPGTIIDVGNPTDGKTTAAVSFELRQPDSPLVVIESIWFTAERFRLIDAEGCPNDAPADQEAAEALEIAAGARSRAISFEKSAGDYCVLGLLLDTDSEATIPAGAPDELGSASFVLLGRRAIDDAPVKIVLEVSDKMRLEAVGDSFALDGRETTSLVVSLDAASWFDAATLDAATLDADDTIVVDAEHNAPVLAKVIEGMRSDITLLLDDDGDGDLSDAERGAPLATGGLVAP